MSDEQVKLAMSDGTERDCKDAVPVPETGGAFAVTPCHHDHYGRLWRVTVATCGWLLSPRGYFERDDAKAAAVGLWESLSELEQEAIRSGDPERIARLPLQQRVIRAFNAAGACVIPNVPQEMTCP